jgi:hypothetical protein
MRNFSKTKWNAVLSRGAHQHACCCYSIKFVRLESISWRNGSSTTSRTWHVFPPTLKICNKIPIDIPHTCAWCVTYQKRNETLFCLVAHINMHAVAIRSSLYALNRFIDEISWRNGSSATSRLYWWHSTHTCAWCVTYQKRNETLFCLVAHMNMHAVAIRSSLYGLNRFLDEMRVAQHRAHGTFSLPHWKFVTKYRLTYRTHVHDA